MIERLMKQEIRYGEPEYSKINAEILEIQRKLAEQLGDADFEFLDQLSGLLLRQGNAELESAFIHGFCSAVELMLDYLRWKNT